MLDLIGKEEMALPNDEQCEHQTSRPHNNIMTNSAHLPLDIPIAPSHDILKYERHPLDAILKPKSVAVIGASEKADSVGRTGMDRVP